MHGLGNSKMMFVPFETESNTALTRSPGMEVYTSLALFIVASFAMGVALLLDGLYFIKKY